jgi:hypothetical protein
VVKPPSTVTSAPVTNDEASDASQKKAPTNSLGFQYLFIGV